MGTKKTMTADEKAAYDRRTEMINDYLARLARRIDAQKAAHESVSALRRRVFPWRIRFDRL